MACLQEKINLPPPVTQVIDRLWSNGWPAYAVGGCVRDSLLGCKPTDWDLTTAATPAEVEALFPEAKQIETGIAHGTVTLIFSGCMMEITTFRQDGAYPDGRHPKEVAFVPVLQEDLKRRDFTVNAMAYARRAGLIDLYNGQRDLSEKKIRCVGVPEKRLSEDALRILRALRFAACLDFEIEPETGAALKALAGKLQQISAERIAAELVRLLCGRAAGRVLREYGEVLLPVIPELAPMMACTQNNPYHDRDVWAHTLGVLDAVPQKKDLRLAALFHDMGKPDCKTTDPQGIDHFRGHPARSEELAVTVLNRLKLDKKTVAHVAKLVRWHDLRFDGSERACRRLLQKVGAADFENYCLLRRADTIGQNPALQSENLKKLEIFQQLGEKLIAEDACFSVTQLAVGGKELLALGIPAGRRIGALLEELVEAVINGDCANEREALLRLAAEKSRE